MKVTDPDVIKAGERDLIEAIKDDLDWNAIKEVFLNKIKSSSFDIKDGALSFDVSGGEIVVHGGAIAFRLDVQLKTEIPIMFDRKGNYIFDKDPLFYEDNSNSDVKENHNIDDDIIDELNLEASSENIASDIKLDSDINSELDYNGDSSIGSEVDSDQLIDDDELLDDISSLEDEDILGDMAGEESEDISAIEELNILTKDDGIEEILQESRDFWKTD